MLRCLAANARITGAWLAEASCSTASGAEDDPELCPNKQCTSAGLDEIESAKSSATISTVGFIAGGVLLAGGATMVILGMSQDSKSDASNPRTIHIAKNVELERVKLAQLDASLPRLLAFAEDALG